MARKTLIPVALVLLCFLSFSTQLAAHSQPALKMGDIDKKLSDKLLNKGYGAMAIFGLAEYLDHLLTKAPSKLTHNNNITAITVFCPTDKGFISQNHIGIPSTLLQYHVIPFKVDRKALESSPVGSTFPTLLANAPPLVKTLHAGKVSINKVAIMDWEIYNDGKVIVHGVDDFFNPAFAVVYPSVVAKKDCAECGKNLDDDDDGVDEIPSTISKSSLLFLELMEQVLESAITMVPLMALLAVMAAIILGLSCYRCFYKTWDECLILRKCWVKTVTDDDALSSLV